MSMDTYQPIFDAVGTALRNTDVGQAVENSCRGILDSADRAFNIMAQNFSEAYESPSAVYKPSLKIDGDTWCALYGDNIQEGVCGFGDTPGKAMADFNRNWLWTPEQIKSAKQVPPQGTTAGEE